MSEILDPKLRMWYVQNALRIGQTVYETISGFWVSVTPGYTGPWAIRSNDAFIRGIIRQRRLDIFESFEAAQKALDELSKEFPMSLVVPVLDEVDVIQDA